MIAPFETVGVQEVDVKNIQRAVLLLRNVLLNKLPVVSVRLAPDTEASPNPGDVDAAQALFADLLGLSFKRRVATLEFPVADTYNYLHTDHPPADSATRIRFHWTEQGSVSARFFNLNLQGNCEPPVWNWETTEGMLAGNVNSSQIEPVCHEIEADSHVLLAFRSFGAFPVAHHFSTVTSPRRSHLAEYWA